jgi:hypothetical protein
MVPNRQTHIANCTVALAELKMEPRPEDILAVEGLALGPTEMIVTQTEGDTGPEGGIEEIRGI